MRLYLTGNPCSQSRHCYFVEGKGISFLFDCGYQRAYRGDELPHLSQDQIQRASYLFLSHSHENQSGSYPWLMSRGFSGRVVTTTETARQLPFSIDDPLILEGLSLPYESFTLPGGLSVLWGRSGHCSGSAWFRFEESQRSLFFSGDYYDCARVHACDPIVGMQADLAVLDCDYGLQNAQSRQNQIDILIETIADALADQRPVLLPVPRYGRGMGILTYLCERLPSSDIFADMHFIRELGHLDASAMWVKKDIQDLLDGVYVRSIPEDFLALGIYFISDPQLDTPQGRHLAEQILLYGGKVIFTGTVEPNTHASLLMHAGQASLLRYGVHCSQEDMLRIAAQNDFGSIIAYHSDFAPSRPSYEV